MSHQDGCAHCGVASELAYAKQTLGAHLITALFGAHKEAEHRGLPALVWLWETRLRPKEVTRLMVLAGAKGASTGQPLLSGCHLMPQGSPSGGLCQPSSALIKDH